MSDSSAAVRSGFAAVLAIVLAITLSGCAWLGSWLPQFGTRAEVPQPVEMISGGLLVARSGKAELGLTLANTSDQTLWISAHFQTPGGVRDCVLAKELEAQAKRLYLCPQPFIQTDTDYPVRVTVFSDLEQTQVLDTLDTSFRFVQADLKTVAESGKEALD